MTSTQENRRYPRRIESQTAHFQAVGITFVLTGRDSSSFILTLPLESNGQFSNDVAQALAKAQLMTPPNRRLEIEFKDYYGGCVKFTVEKTFFHEGPLTKMIDKAREFISLANLPHPKATTLDHLALESMVITSSKINLPVSPTKLYR